MACNREQNRRQRITRLQMRPCAEGLEDRKLLYATLGGQWFYGSRITYSFAPDGTDVGGLTSTWNQRMDSLGISESAWKDQFRRAAATWASIANINMVEVADDGSAISIAGNQQGDSRFGDIRIVGVSLGSGVLATAFMPPPFNGGTLAGDIVMNVDANWKVSNDYDIMTVALHEMGHSLGLDHSTISQAVMNATYTGMKQSLTSDDVSGMRSVYEARQPDPFEGPFGNNTYNRSTIINSYLDASGQIRLATPDLSGATDSDWYYVVAPASTTGTMTVSMQSTGLSSLSPRIQVLNNSLQNLGVESAPGAFGATVTVTLNGVVPGSGYFIRAMAASSGPTSAGAYGLLVNFGSSPMSPISPPNTTVPEALNQGGGGVSQTSAPVNPKAADAAIQSITQHWKKHCKTNKKDQGQEFVVRVGNIMAIGETFSSDKQSPNWGEDRNPRGNALGALVPLLALGVNSPALTQLSTLFPDQLLHPGASSGWSLIDSLLDDWFID